MSNPCIPDQLHHMSKKELLEFAHTSHEENVKLLQQLAKANERVKDFIAYMHDAQKWFDKHDPNGYMQNSHPEAIKALNKFAIEQKIEALESALRENSRSVPYPYDHNTDIVYSEDIKFDIEQLRKE